MDTWNEMIQDLHSGKEIVIDGEIFDYFLEVLPPVGMGIELPMPDGRNQKVSFGFAEGAELVVGFWKEKTGDDVVYKAQQSTMMNPYA